MKAGIVTFHTANNYGAVLQCYALSEVLKMNGLDVGLVELPLHGRPETLRGKIRDYLSSRAFKKFRKTRLPPVVDYIDLNGPCFFGSDQVWNLDITREYYDLYMGANTPPGLKKIAYAASFGGATWSHHSKTERCSMLLSQFYRLGIREASGVEICKTIFRVEATQVLDPTLLLTDYSQLFKKKQLKQTMACYIYVKDSDAITKLRSIAQKRSISPVLLNDFRFRPGIRSVPFPTVSEWLSRIEASNLVVTDSFHCMVFAILFQKDFIVVPAIRSRVDRMVSLLTELNLRHRFFDSLELALNSDVLEQTIDYNPVLSKLEALREKSIDFIKHSLEGVECG